MEQNSKYRNFAMTDFVLDPEIYDELASKYKYIIRGEELCPETQKTHYQVFLICKSPRSLKSLIKEWKPRHVEVCKGDYLSNINYCSKDSNFKEYGERPKGQGKRSDIDIIREALDDKPNMRHITTIATSFQSIRLAECYLTYNETRRNWKPFVSWIYGPTGTGKSEMAQENCEPDYWMSNKNLRWWQGYDAHENVIIDDFRGDFCTFHELLRILDKYPYRIEVKGGSRQLLARNIYITSPFHPKEVYNTREDIGQLLRRIDEIVKTKKWNTSDGTEVGGNTKTPPSSSLEDLISEL